MTPFAIWAQTCSGRARWLVVGVDVEEVEGVAAVVSARGFRKRGRSPLFPRDLYLGLCCHGQPTMYENDCCFGDDVLWCALFHLLYVCEGYHRVALAHMVWGEVF